MSMLVPLEGYPTTGLFQSFNGRIMFGGFPIIRVENATFTISHNVDIFYEVGRREGIPYVKEFDVRGSIRRAYINGVEWKLAIGFMPRADVGPSGGTIAFDPGKIYDDDNDLKKIAGGSDYDNAYLKKNTYPIKTVARFDVNTKDFMPSTLDGSETLNPYTLQAEVRGVTIDALTLTIGESGDLVTSGPIDWIGETVSFKVEEVTA